MKKKYLLTILLMLFPQILLAEEVLFDKLDNDELATFLGWTKSSPTAENFCGGFFQEPKIVIDYPNAPDMKESVTNVTAKKQVVYAEQGDATLEGSVVISQPGRQLIANKIVLHRDVKTNKFSSADLYGGVQLFEFGKLVVGNTGYINFTNNVVIIDNAIYRLSVPKNFSAEQLTLWGRAKQILRDESKELTFFNSSYSTCQPDTEAWHITSSKLHLNKETGVGTANNVVLNIKDMPVLYLPYAQFPLDNRRKSGFLFPAVNYSGNSGLELDIPFYLNLAPNYDATITPEIMTKRGVLFDGLFRYLTSSSSGQLDLQYIFNDNEFKDYKKETVLAYPNDAALQDLEDSSDNRGFISWQNNSRFNSHWNSVLNVNYVSDDYFLHDFGVLPSLINEDQLFNQAMVTYSDDHWQFFGQVQAFQTLHLVNETAEDQYMRLPQLNLAGAFPGQKYGLSYQLNAEYVYFDHRSIDFYDSNKIYPIGNRFNIVPSVELPLNWGGAFLDPKVQLNATYYGLTNVPIATEVPIGTSKDITRITPIIDVDSGLLFKRNMNYFSGYTQTLEPRLFYLYVPKENQNDIPVFDTNPSAVSFDNLFRTNRFSSIDRIGDANQFSLALISRMLNAATGEEKLRASIGETIALQEHTVCLDSEGNNNCDSDPLASSLFSPIFGQLKYYPNPNWSATADASWDMSTNALNSVSATIGYSKAKRIINVNYSYLVNGDSYDDQTVNLNRLDISASWPLTQHWQVMGDWKYYASSGNAQAYIYGIEYNSCCWAIRFVGSHVYEGYDEFENRFYLQFLLKGLGSIATSDPNSILTSNITNFRDDFK